MHPNEGQWDDRIQYKVDLNHGEMLIEKQGFYFHFNNAYEYYHSHHDGDKKKEHDNLRFHAIKSFFQGSNLNAIQEKTGFSNFYRNYFLDNDPAKWKSKVKSCSGVKYRDFYAGIDLVLESGTDDFKYSFYVAPGADPVQIINTYSGADNIRLLKSGALDIHHSFGIIHEGKPIAWNLDEQGNKHRVPVKYKLKGNQLSYEFPEGYNAQQTLVIDPSLTFSSYTGSTADNWGNTATPDAATNLYAGGIVFASGYPLTAGSYDNNYDGGTTSGVSLPGFDMGISKFSADGSVFLYSTYLGASVGNETPLSLVVDDNGNLFVLGATSSSNFPMRGNSFQSNFAGGQIIQTASGLDYNGTDIVVAKLNSDGTDLICSTFLGGSANDGLIAGDLSSSVDLVHNYGDNFRGEIILDEAGNVIIASTTNSGDFPVLNANQPYGGGQDAVFVRMTPDLSSLLWSTYFGGAGAEAGYSVQSNGSGDVYVTGGTNSPNLSMNGAQTSYGGATDGFLLRLNEGTGSILSSTFVGTSSYDQSYFVQVDNQNDVYVYGQTNGNMSISAGLYGNPSAGQFIRKYNPNLSTVLWTTKVGGSSSNSRAISPTAFLVSDCREIYFAGWGGDILGTNISNFPTSSDAFQSTTDGDAFYIAVLDKDAVGLKYATFIGGAAQDHVDGGTSRFDKTGRIYHAVCSSCGVNNGFVSTPGVAGPNSNSSRCNLAAFKFELNTILPLVVEPDYVICAPQEVTFENKSTEGDQYFWDFGDGITSTSKDPSHTYLDAGVFQVKLVVSDSENCKLSDSVVFDLEVGSHDPGQVVQPPIICRGTSYQFEASGGAFFTWSPASFLDDPNISNPTATVDQTTEFRVIIGDSCGIDTVYVTLEVYDDAIQVSNDQEICVNSTIEISVQGAQQQVWSPNTFISNILISNPEVTPPNSLYYYVDATTVNGCQYRDSVFVEVFHDPPVPILQEEAQLCEGEQIAIQVSGGTTYQWTPDLYINNPLSSTVLLNPPESMYYYCNVSNPCGTTPDTIFIEVIHLDITASEDQIVCGGDSVSLFAFGAEKYLWEPNLFLNDNTLPTVIANPDKTMFYTVTGTDQYGCTDTDTVRVELYPATSIELGANIIAEIGDQIYLTAETDANGTFLWTPPKGLSCATCQSTYAAPNFNTNYIVYFTDENGCVTTDNVQILYKGIIYVPNTFTPDGNRHNQYFRAVGDGLLHFELNIFNRWGELIATLNDLEDSWDGTYKGKDCPDGTYTWKLSYVDVTGEKQVMTGHVNLLR